MQWTVIGLLCSSLLLCCSSICCGSTTFLEKRVIGGEYAPPAKYPWAIAIRADMHEAESITTCGATIIAEQWLLSAGHCFWVNGVDARDPKKWHIMAGQVFVPFAYFEDTKTELGAKTHNEKTILDKSHYHVDKIIIHPKYKPDRLEWDIALIHLNRPLPLDKLPGISAVNLPLPSQKSTFPKIGDTSCVVVGWGCTESGGNPNTKAKVLHLPPVTNKVCNKAFDNEADLNDRHEFCAGFINGGSSVCRGDSGGGLVCKNNGRWTVAGVVSAGQLEKAENYPGIFTRVAFFTDWIRSEMAKGK